MSDALEAKRKQLGAMGWGINDSKDKTPDPDTDPEGYQRHRLDSQKIEWNRKDWQIEQAVARGLISAEDAAVARSKNRSSWVQKKLGFNNDENTGSTLETA